jgi:hypothetical protein
MKVSKFRSHLKGEWKIGPPQCRDYDFIHKDFLGTPCPPGSICFFYLGSGPAGTMWITAM